MAERILNEGVFYVGTSTSAPSFGALYERLDNEGRSRFVQAYAHVIREINDGFFLSNAKQKRLRRRNLRGAHSAQALPDSRPCFPSHFPSYMPGNDLIPGPAYLGCVAESSGTWRFVTICDGVPLF